MTYYSMRESFPLAVWRSNVDASMKPNPFSKECEAKKTLLNHRPTRQAMYPHIVFESIELHAFKGCSIERRIGMPTKQSVRAWHSKAKKIRLPERREKRMIYILGAPQCLARA
jgi:hypothetical protein